MSLNLPRRALIVTALQIERAAVVEHLREVSEEPPVGGSIYRRGVFDEGRLDSWEVVVAEIGAGNERAAAETERAISHYSPEVAIFVGVAGAVKDLKHGDVVASTKVYGYESGKDDKGGFKTRPGVQLSAYDLESRARHEAGESDWRQRIKPGSQPETESIPHARVAPIAAGEKVVAWNRSETYQFIREQYGDAVAVEMEGHGFLLGVHMNHPTLGIVVRGISDLVDDKDEANDDFWQPIAARHAAAFAFQILAKHTSSRERVRSQAPSPRLDPSWQEKHMQEARATAGPRYSSELRLGTPLHDVFEALGDTKEWQTTVRARHRKLSKLVDHFRACVETRDTRAWGAPFPEHLRDIGNDLAERLRGVEQAMASIADGKQGGTPTAVALMASDVLPELRELQAELRSDFEKQHGDGAADSASFRQYQAEYQMSFPAANIDAARDLVSGLEELGKWAESGPGRASGSNGVLLLGDAGVGKTHGICDIGHDRFRRGLYTVVLFGEQFTAAQEPWERIRQILGFGPISRDEMLDTLDAAGAASGRALLLCIDGLNETRPRAYWNSRLAPLTTQIARYSHIRLCVSCRSSYEPVVVPDGHGLERVEHVGFAGMEFTASRHFFAHYGLEPPVGPSFHPEFSNPLFLRLACETLQATGQRQMPAGWHGLGPVLDAFLREKNRAFAREYERDERERVPQQALHEFMTEVERTRRVYLRWGEATAAVGRAQPGGLVGPSLLDWLVRSGLLIADADPENSSPGAEEVVRVAFERLGDHLFASRLLSGINSGDLQTAIQSGPLSFAFDNAEAVLNNQGLVEALSIQVPEHPDFFTELVDALPPESPRDAVLRATISALPWRDPEHMTNRTRQVVLERLTTKGCASDVFDKILAVATQVTAPDALWLHEQLARQSMPSRDQFLCGYLYQRIGEASEVERLLRAPFEVESNGIPEPVCIRWATILLWFCAAADRRMRDRATKGLVAITEARPRIWVTLIDEFASVNDEYVVERCFCAAYGVLLRSRDRQAEEEVAKATYEAVFADQTALQNALIRDHARCILELAQRDGVLPAGVDINRARPPYESDWPLTIPSEADVEQYKEARSDFPKLYWSCLDDDFFTYTLSRLAPYEHAVSRNEMGRWILKHVVSDLGYGGEGLASYDEYMLYKYGGGRGRPGWAERIGKKYQWIALSRLAARLADHVEPKADSWEPEVQGIPLIYARGRDIDPGLLAHGGLPSREQAVWWLPVEYDFTAVADQSNAEWATALSDVPSSESLLQPLEREDGGEWQLLEGYPSWSSKSGEESDDSFAPQRNLWQQIRGYLVESNSAARVFEWMSKQHFWGRWMPEGAEFHEGYIGEYPWGILFTMFPDRWYSRGDDNKAPASFLPICNSVSVNYEGDAYQGGGISVQVPARVFFERDGQLRWDGLNGYHDAERIQRFIDPSVAEPGASALLVDRGYLLEFLRLHEFAVVWSVLGEKIFLGGPVGAADRLAFSRAHLLDWSGTLRSSELLVHAD